MDKNDASRIVVVTGASKGIGAQIARKLEAQGYSILGVSRKRPATGAWAAGYVECDLADEESVVRLIQELGHVDRVWGLVNCAGVGKGGAIEDLSLDDFRSVFMINTFVPAMVAQAVTSQMVDGGRIVNICSNVMHGKPYRSVYGSSKAALAAMTKTWALELASRNITVNAISPGPVDTELFRRRHPQGSAAETEVTAKIPLERIATTEDVAYIAAMLMSTDAGYVTGQIVTVDGGATIGAGPA